MELEYPLPDGHKPRKSLFVSFEGSKEDIKEEEELENCIAEEEDQYGGSEATRFCVIDEIAGVDELASIDDSLGHKFVRKWEIGCEVWED